MKKIAVFMLLFASCMTGAFLIRAYTGAKAPVSDAQSQVLHPTRTPPDPPVELSIPTIGITTPIESVAMDKDGNMDVPKNADDVGWYTLGFAPGDSGSAVIAGHFDKKDGSPAVFYSLGKLAPGDSISVRLKSGKTLSFSVATSTSYPENALPLGEIFNSRGTPTLNLITCKGTFDRTTKNYSHRLVVTSRLQS